MRIRVIAFMLKETVFGSSENDKGLHWNINFITTCVLTNYIFLKIMRKLPFDFRFSVYAFLKLLIIRYGKNSRIKIYEKVFLEYIFRLHFVKN